jgi:hypothetical protein
MKVWCERRVEMLRVYRVTNDAIECGSNRRFELHSTRDHHSHSRSDLGAGKRGREQPPNRVRGGSPPKAGGLLTPRLHCRRWLKAAGARHRAPRVRWEARTSKLHVCYHFPVAESIGARRKWAFA